MSTNFHSEIMHFGIIHIVTLYLSMEKEEIGLKIARMRETLNKSARALSLELGMSSEYLNQIEKGRSRPSIDFLYNFCDYFNITVSDFFESKSNFPIEHKKLAEQILELDKQQLDAINTVVEVFLRTHARPVQELPTA